MTYALICDGCGENINTNGTFITLKVSGRFPDEVSLHFHGWACVETEIIKQKLTTYYCKCHVCGIEHTHQAYFLSGTVWVQEDGRELVMMSCGRHSAEEVKKAYGRIH